MKIIEFTRGELYSSRCLAISPARGSARELATKTGALARLLAFATAAGLTIGLLGCTGMAPSERPTDYSSAMTPTQGVMYVGGRYRGTGADSGVVDQMYVFYQIPKGYRPGQDGKWPIVMVHGSQQTGANFLGTPDGRPGWAWYFFSNGWPVYVVDQPGRGKSGYFPDVYGPQAASPKVGQVQSLFTAPESTLPIAWPEAALHTQWPGGLGSGKPGNEAFDQFMASQVANMPEYKQALFLTTQAIGLLLDKIGPAILMTHSMAGPVSWMVPQKNSGKIKAIIAIEPTGNSGSRGDTAPGSPCGLSDECLEFSPPIQGAADLGLTKIPSATPGLRSCWLQKEPVHALAGLAGIPILIATGEASYHASYDYCTSNFLTQAGVANTWLNLASVGIKGNGHMQMIEMNNLEIARYYERWLLHKLK